MSLRAWSPSARADDPPVSGTAREGWPYVAGLSLLGLLLWHWKPLAGASTLGLAGAVGAFFRDPVRPFPTDLSLLYGPADGTVIGVDTVENPWFVGRRSHRVSIFLSLLDVHVNRSPVSGTVAAVRDLGTGFAPAMHFERSHGNRRREVGITTERGPVLVVQVAGLLARRIVPWAQSGDQVVAGQKIGMITFGSRTDLIVPMGVAEPCVTRGQRVVGGQTAIARWC